ncbi:MAG: hypothetical protein J2P52_17655, partial [Blastocatellia bacterium]|nr:hypothetical protein [Blastocatellia bacterium]
MHRKMNFLISALFTLIVSSAVTAQTPAPAPGPGVYTGGIAPRATPPGLNGTYQPGVITTQPPAPGTGVYTTNGASIAPRATPPGLNGTYQAPIQGAGAVGGTA